ncbi:MAG: efflux RND transporter periplasmic adaptor subunit [Lachnospiraceae bacterium]|nr:efflux RND transporter periplasmic adaptor subunit [Lachnospiraceae bacterium]
MKIKSWIKKYISEHKKRTIAIAFVAAAVIIFGVRAAGSGDGTAGQDVSDGGATVIELQKQDLSETIHVDGKVESQHSVDVTTDLTSKCNQLNVALGDHVEKGDVLCVFDTQEITEQIAALEQQTNSTAAQDALSQGIAQRELSEAVGDNASSLGTEQEKEDRTERRLELTEDKITETEAEIEETKSTLKDVEDRISDLEDDVRILTSEQSDYESGTDDYDDVTDDLDDANSRLSELQKRQTKLNDRLSRQRSRLSAQKSKRTTLKSEQETQKDTRRELDKSMRENLESAQDTVDQSAIRDTTDASLTKELATLRRQLADATIVAAQSGTVTTLNIAEGGRANGKLMVISDPTELQVSVAIKEKDILKLKERMKAKVTTDAIPDEKFKGTVARVINFTTEENTSASGGGSSDAGSGSSATKYSADITMDKPGDLLLGMSVKAEIALSKADEELAVPYDSIVDEGGTAYILAAEDTGDGENYTVKKYLVQTGASNDYYTAVSGDGIKEGLLVLAEPQDYAEGDAITILNIGDAIETEMDAE